MNLDIYQVDAFAEKTFEGNPAAVCPLEAWLSDEMMQAIALENNLSETAFFVKNGDAYDLRWFTPAVEVDLCGHATLASAHVLFNHLGYSDEIIRFNSRSGPLSVKKEEEMLILDFPADTIAPAEAPAGLIEAMGFPPKEVLKGKTDYMLVYRSQEVIESLQPNFDALGGVEARGVIATAPGKEHDFVSRFFAPAAGVNEDPVTGSAHTSLTPYWAAQLGKAEMSARQLSQRGGNVRVKLNGERVEIGGKAVTYMAGEVISH